MGKIIHPHQRAFVPDILIQNILIAREVFHSFRRNTGRTGWIAIKFDMEKAYDRLEQKFVFVMLEKLRFDTQWIEWIKTCISTSSFFVLVNGITGLSFTPSRGIRQGDHLSPYLFILCAELLARQYAIASSQRDRLIGIPIGNSSVRIPFLTFADDYMIFAKANDQSFFVIRQILVKYCSMLGQVVNYHKYAFQVSPYICFSSPKGQLCFHSRYDGMI